MPKFLDNVDEFSHFPAQHLSDTNTYNGFNSYSYELLLLVIGIDHETVPEFHEPLIRRCTQTIDKPRSEGVVGTGFYGPIPKPPEYTKNSPQRTGASSYE